MSRRDTVTVTVTVELPERPTSAQVTFGEAQQAITRVTHSAEFTTAVLVALSDYNGTGKAALNASPTYAKRGHRAAEVTANLSTEYV